MSLSIEDLVTPITLEEARASVYNVLVALGVPTTAWYALAVVKVVVEVVAIILYGVGTVVALIARARFREYATGDWLTICARQTYGVDRLAATQAAGLLTLVNSGANVYSLDPGDLIVAHSVTGKTYTNTEAISIPAATTVTGVAIVAVELGSASSAAAGTITVFVTPLLGVTCTNPAALVGTDEETDEQLRARCDASIDALSPNGPAGAYLAAAMTAVRADGTNVGVTRCAVSAPSSIGELTVTVASATGALTGGDLTYVNTAIQTQAVPLGVTATVANSVDHPIDVTADLYVYTTDGRTQTEIEDAAEALLVAWMPTKPISGDSGGKIYQAAIRAILMSVSTHCYNGTVTLPAADVTIAAGEVPTLGTPTIIAHMVTP